VRHIDAVHSVCGPACVVLATDDPASDAPHALGRVAAIEQKAIAGKRIPTFEHLTHLSDNDFYSDDTGVNYAAARYLLYYLQERGLLRTYFQRFLENHQRDPSGYDTLVDVLGRMRDRIPVYASGINLGMSEDELLEQVKSWQASGYQGFKVKVGKPDVNEDVERLTKVRELIGAAPLMVDANQGWGPELAPRRINALRGLDLTWIEEPLISDDISGHARLRTQIETPIGVGENIYNIYQWRDYLASGAVDFVQADVVRVGGITPYLEIAALAQACDVLPKRLEPGTVHATRRALDEQRRTDLDHDPAAE